MADIRQNPQTGELAVRIPGTQDFRPITPEQAKALTQGTLGNIKDAAIAANQDMASDFTQGILGNAPDFMAADPIMGGAKLMTQLTDALGITVPTPAPLQQGADYLSGVAQGNDPTQQAIAQEDPVAGVAGSLLTADNLIPGPPAAAGVRVAKPVVRSFVNSADNVVRAGASRATKGARAFARTVPVVGDFVDDAAEGLARRGRNKALNAATVDAGEGAIRSGVKTVDEFLEYGAGQKFDIPPEMRLAVEGRSKGDIKLGRGLTDEAAMRENTDPGLLEQMMQGDRTSVTAVQQDVQDMLNDTTLRELGSTADFLDKPAVGERMDEISKSLTKLQDEAGPISGEGLSDVIAKKAEENLASPDVERVANRLSQLVESKIDDTGSISAADHSIIRNRIEKSLRSAGRTQSDPELADFLEEIRDEIIDRVSVNWSDAQLAEDATLRRQWGLARNLTDSSAAIGENGVNATSLMNSAGRGRAGKAARLKGDYWDFVRTAQELLRKVPTSNTPRIQSRSKQGAASVLGL